MIKKCLSCKNEFNAHTNSTKYCSKKCYSDSMKTGKFIFCKICNKKFYVNKYRLEKENAKYCSVECGCKIANQRGKNVKCPNCGKLHFLSPSNIKLNRKFCSNKCRFEYKVGINSNNWKTGKSSNGNGYIIAICNDHPKANKGYVLEHRLIMEKHIGRYLSSEECVHHINGIKTDNRIENLMLFPNTAAHLSYHKLMRRK